MQPGPSVSTHRQRHGQTDHREKHASVPKHIPTKPDVHMQGWIIHKTMYAYIQMSVRTSTSRYTHTECRTSRDPCMTLYTHNKACTPAHTPQDVYIETQSAKDTHVLQMGSLGACTLTHQWNTYMHPFHVHEEMSLQERHMTRLMQKPPS